MAPWLRNCVWETDLFSDWQDEKGTKEGHRVPLDKGAWESRNWVGGS